MSRKTPYEGRLSDAWESAAHDWARWAREPGHDSYWRFHRDRFFALLPPPDGLTLDIGAGEGRVTRDLITLGYKMVPLDRSPTLTRLAKQAGTTNVIRADAAELPLRTDAFDLAIAFMSAQDMDDMPAAIAEAGRVLKPDGRLCLAVVHPINAIGEFDKNAPDARFTVTADYFERRRYADRAQRDGLTITFHQGHWTLEDYFSAIERAGLLVEAVREPPAGNGGPWDRMPLFLHIRALKPA